MIGNQLLLEIPQGDQLGEGLDAGYLKYFLTTKLNSLLRLITTIRNRNWIIILRPNYELSSLVKKNVQIFESLDDDAFSKEFQQQNLGTSLWKYFLYAVLFFLLVEIALIRFKK